MEHLFAPPQRRQVRFSSIRLLLIYALLLAVLIPAVATNVFAASRSLTNAQKQAANQLDTMATLRELQVNTWLDNLQLEMQQQVTDLSAKIDAAVKAGPGKPAAADLQTALSEAVGRAANRQALFLVDPQGLVVNSSDSNLLGHWFTEWVTSGLIVQPSIVPLTSAVADSGVPAGVMVLQPIVSGPMQTGAMVALYSLQPLTSIMENTTGLGATGETYLVSRQNALLTASRFPSYMVGTVLNRTQGIQQALTSHASGDSQYASYHQDAVVGAYGWLSRLQVAVLAEQEVSEIQSTTVDTLGVNALVTLVAAMIAIVAGLFLVDRRISQPLESLSQTAHAIAEGNLTLRSTLNPHNEIGVLAQSFNRMTAQLADLINTLEERVKDRTRDLEAARQEAEKANHLKSQFLANMSHELRTPLNAILNYSQFVLQEFMGPINEEQKQALDTVVSSGNHLLNLINDILDVAKIEVGKMEFLFEPTDLADVLKGVLSIGKGLLKDKPIKLLVEFDEDLPTIKGDNRRLHQVLLNLLSNAVKFTLEGSITLAGHREGENVHLAVRDTGLGIAPEDQELIFESFRQAEHGLRLSNAGTGLGLPISKYIVEAHGGRMWVESEPGKGSTFHVLLPIDGNPQEIAAVQAVEQHT